MSIEDVDGDIFRSGKGIYLNYRHYVEMEKNNPHGLGYYPRRMIVVDNQETKNSMEDENERREKRADSNNS